MNFAAAASFAALVVFVVHVHPAHAETASPLGKVLELLSGLQSKILQEGEESQKVFAKYTEWCEERSRELSFEIKTGTSEADALKASIAESVSTIAAVTAKIEELAASVASSQKDLKAATEIRGKEHADFLKAEKELMETTNVLDRAIGLLEREFSKGGSASMLQDVKNAGNVLQAVTLLVQASAISSADAAKLTAFVQDSDADEADDMGAPASAVYSGHSGSILDTLQSLADKAEEQLADIRKKETTDQHNFELLQQSLEDESKFAAGDLDAAKKRLAGSGAAKATAEGDLANTKAELLADEGAKADLHHACLSNAEDFEAETKSRGEELKALAEAKKVLEDSTKPAETITYSLAQNSVSLVQLARSSFSSGMDLANFEAVRFVRDLARKQGSAELAQLAQRMGAAMRVAGDARGRAADPFAKVKGLIQDMIAKLQNEAGADATKKAYCDRELSETKEKKTDKSAEVEKLSTKIDQLSAQSAQLKEEVNELQKSLASLASAQAELDKLRLQEKAAFVSSKADLEKGLEGVKTALKVLNEYYSSTDKAHAAANGAGTSIIGLLEVVESDFTKGLAETTATEDTAVRSYTEESRENEIEKAAKEKDVAYKTKESAFLDKTIGELSSDRSNVQAELDAVLEYLSKIEEQCIAKAESYDERTSRREAEIAGLKEALQILESETALLQQEASKRRFLRASNLRRQLAAW